MSARLARQAHELPVRRAIAVLALEPRGERRDTRAQLGVIVHEALVAQRGRGVHALGHGADATERLEEHAPGLETAREREHRVVVGEPFSGFGALEQDVHHRVVQVVVEQGLGIAPLGDARQLRVVLEVGGLLGLEAAHAEGREPRGDPR